MGIKAVEMVRKIRDDNHETGKHLATDEQLRRIHDEAADFLKKLDENRAATACSGHKARNVKLKQGAA